MDITGGNGAKAFLYIVCWIIGIFVVGFFGGLGVGIWLF